MRYSRKQLKEIPPELFDAAQKIVRSALRSFDQKVADY
jgi:hypothetical protein